MQKARWRVVAVALMAGVLVGLLPATALAAEARVKTKIVFLGMEAGAYRDYWSIDTTSVPPTYAKARLMYYKPSVKKWVGYASRPVKVTRGDDPEVVRLSWKKTTDSRGYFTVKMSRPTAYIAEYAGSKFSLPCKKSESLLSEVEVSRSSTITTSSVDATHTRYTFVTDYEYNPYVAKIQGHVGLLVAFGVTDFAVSDWRNIYRGETELIERPFTGSARSEFSVVAPSDTFDDGVPFLWVMVTYPGQWDFTTEDYDDNDPWFY